MKIMHPKSDLLPISSPEWSLRHQLGPTLYGSPRAGFPPEPLELFLRSAASTLVGASLLEAELVVDLVEEADTLDEEGEFEGFVDLSGCSDPTLALAASLSLRACACASVSLSPTDEIAEEPGLEAVELGIAEDDAELEVVDVEAAIEGVEELLSSCETSCIENSRSSRKPTVLFTVVYQLYIPYQTYTS
jgi:hypothetical protein